MQKIKGEITDLFKDPNRGTTIVRVDDRQFVYEGDQELEKGLQIEAELDGSCIKKIRGEEESGRTVESSTSGLGGAPDISKQERIKRSMAFKTAAQQIDRRHADDEADYREQLKDMTEIHMEVLDEVMNNAD